jgi:predicted membrane protein
LLKLQAYSKFWSFPIIGWIIGAIAGIWQLVAMVVAVRQALDYDSIWRTLGVVVIGFIIVVIVLAIIGGLIAVVGGPELPGI